MTTMPTIIMVAKTGLLTLIWVILMTAPRDSAGFLLGWKPTRRGPLKRY